MLGWGGIQINNDMLHSEFLLETPTEVLFLGQDSHIISCFLTEFFLENIFILLGVNAGPLKSRCQDQSRHARDLLVETFVINR